MFVKALFFPLSSSFRYREVCDYNFDTHRSIQLKTGHFTQMVWRKSEELGVGVATGTKHGLECTYIVARYRPAGNVYGQYSENVLKGTFDESFCNNAVQDDGSGSGSGSGQGSGIERRNRWRPSWGSASGQGSGSGGSG